MDSGKVLYEFILFSDKYKMLYVCKTCRVFNVSMTYQKHYLSTKLTLMDYKVSFNQLYQDNFYKIYKFVKNNRGKKDDSEDLFQDALLVLMEKLQDDNFKLTASINTYVYAICKNIWFKKSRNKSCQLTIVEINAPSFQESITISIESEMSYLEKLKTYLTKITDRCNKLITDIFFNRKPIETIQSEYNYTSRHNVQNQQHKCIKQIKRIKAAKGISGHLKNIFNNNI